MACAPAQNGENFHPSRKLAFADKGKVNSVRCATCRRKFEAARRDAITCSLSCRQKRHYRRQSVKKTLTARPARPPPPAPFPDDGPAWWNRCYHGSAKNLAAIPSESVSCCVTSPPYFRLRVYGTSGEIGSEATVEEYIANLIDVFREVRRALRDDGTLWLNLGDTYAEKQLLGVPWRVALALQADRWYLRDAIIWHRTNAIPSSVSDRCTPAYETIFMLARSADYFADMDAVRTPIKGPKVNAPRGSPTPASAYGVNSLTGNMAPGQAIDSHPLGANLRNVWPIALAHYAYDHFATFPVEIPRRCIQIGSPPGGIVLDPFMGSGTTAAAAVELGRRWVGYEINPEYLPHVAARLSDVVA